VLREGNSYNARAYLGEWEGRGERENLLPLLPLAIPAYEAAIAGAGVFSAYMIHRLIKEKAQKEGISLDESAKRLGVVYGEGRRNKDEYQPGPPNIPDKTFQNRKNKSGYTDQEGNIYQRDHLHNRWEVYDKRGNHLGEIDHNGKQTKNKVPGRKIKP
ncbi:colicin E3/pyocin S6 family cytotoxin, partial [Helicobacter cholecystus]|uniref:colicin E3/pyocin S6 family cytotoxin n=1 Tax=Helicobacter cholecystus TaxID=45498 RepID=UPI0027383E5B